MPNRPLSTPSQDAQPLTEGWSVHDRTHLEHVFDCPVASLGAPHRACWEVYFFLPASLRLDADIYPQSAIYRDLQSYTRLHVAACGWPELVAQASALEGLLEEEGASYEVRMFGCAVRTAVARGRERLLAGLGREARSLAPLCQEYMDGVTQTLDQFRAAVCSADRQQTRDAAQRVDEDLSWVVEDACATLALRFERAGLEELGGAFTRIAAAEARYRRACADQEFGRDGQQLRRHALKRFTSSVLWLPHDVRWGGRWALQLMNAVAASLAMLFAVTAAFYHGTQAPGELTAVWPWALGAALAYAGKDRMKATLQSTFARWVGRRFPDRRWKLWHGAKWRVLATVEERFRFVSTVPPAVSEARARADAFSIAPEGRPERILNYSKSFKLKSRRLHGIDPRCVALRDILRLDVQQWLAHTDDAKQHLFLADPDGSRVYHKKGRRRYELVVVGRARTAGAPDQPWETYRVVVQRKGIASLERVPVEGRGGELVPDVGETPASPRLAVAGV